MKRLNKPNKRAIELHGMQRVLVCPAHYFLSKTSGSDITATVNLLLRLAGYFQLFIVCGSSECYIPSVTLIEANTQMPISSEFVFYRERKRIEFLLRYYMIGKHIIRKEKIDVFIHMIPFGYKMTFNPLIIKRHVKNAKVIIGPINYPTTFRGFSFGNILFSYLFSNLQRKTLESADVLVFDGEKTKKIYMKTHPAVTDVHRCKVIPDGIESSIFDYKRPNRTEIKTLLTVGGLIPLKNHRFLLNVLVDLLHYERNVRLKIAGGGPEWQNLQKLSKRLGLTENVQFLGHIDRRKLVQEYQECDIYVHPSKLETFPSVIREAMSCGRPIVASNVGLISEHIHNGYNGFVVQPGDKLGFIRAIEKLLSSQDLRMRMGKRNREYVETHLSHEQIAEKWVDLIRSL